MKRLLAVTIATGLFAVALSSNTAFAVEHDYDICAATDVAYFNGTCYTDFNTALDAAEAETGSQNLVLLKDYYEFSEDYDGTRLAMVTTQPNTVIEGNGHTVTVENFVGVGNQDGMDMLETSGVSLADIPGSVEVKNFQIVKAKGGDSGEFMTFAFVAVGNVQADNISLSCINQCSLEPDVRAGMILEFVREASLQNITINQPVIDVAIMTAYVQHVVVRDSDLAAAHATIDTDENSLSTIEDPRVDVYNTDIRIAAGMGYFGSDASNLPAINIHGDSDYLKQPILLSDATDDHETARSNEYFDIQTGTISSVDELLSLLNDKFTLLQSRGQDVSAAKDFSVSLAPNDEQSIADILGDFQVVAYDEDTDSFPNLIDTANWQSSDESIVKVIDGKLIAIAPGSTAISTTLTHHMLSFTIDLNVTVESSAEPNPNTVDPVAATALIALVASTAAIVIIRRAARR